METKQKYEWAIKTTSTRKRYVAGVLWTLRLDGPIVDSHGFAAGELLERLAKRGITLAPSNLTLIMAGLKAGGRYGYDFDYIERTITGKRTYAIKLAVDPDTVPFPDNPFTDAPASRRRESQVNGRAAGDIIDRLLNVSRDLGDGEAPEVESLQDEADEEAEIATETEDDGPYDDEVLNEVFAHDDHTAPLPSTVDYVDVGWEPSAHDNVLNAISLLNSALGQMTVQPLRDIEALIDQRLAGAAQLLDQTNQLQIENRRLQADKQSLTNALQQSQRAVQQLQDQIRRLQGGRTPARPAQ